MVHFLYSNWLHSFSLLPRSLNAASMQLAGVSSEFMQAVHMQNREEKKKKKKTFGKVSSQRTLLGGLLMELGVKSVCWLLGWR